MRISNLLLSACGLAMLTWGSGCASRQDSTPVSPPTATVPSSSLPPVASVPRPEPAAPAQADKEASSLIARIKKHADVPTAPFEGEGWRDLFDGRDLFGWTEANFGGRGELELGAGLLAMNMGQPFTGIRYTNVFPVTDYEIALDAMRVMGSDFFCALTVPVADSHCSLIVGGWGGALVGISSLNDMDASENETTKFLEFEKERWYRIRMRVTPKRLEAWIDKNKVVDVVISGKRVSLRPGEIENCRPLGIACWQTAAAIREVRFRRVDGPADPPRKSPY